MAPAVVVEDASVVLVSLIVVVLLSWLVGESTPVSQSSRSNNSECASCVDVLLQVQMRWFIVPWDRFVPRVRCSSFHLMCCYFSA
jgi:hypothetical protein